MSRKLETSVAPKPALKSEWHPTRNAGIKFDDLSPKSNTKVWWVCSRNAKHEWDARFRNRVIDGDGCPHCCGRKVLKEDSFGAQFPQMLAEWHPTKNGSLDPFRISPNSNKRVWWQCQTPYKHVWQTTVTTRVRHSSGCKQCNNIPRPLSVSYPEIAKQWHPTKNGDTTANDVSAGSKMKAWWLCDVDPMHEWNATVYGRTRAKSACPQCARKAGPKEWPRLDVAFPKLTAQWHPTRNGLTKPSDVFANSTRKAWGFVLLIQDTNGKPQLEIARYLTTDADSVLAEANILRRDSHLLTSFHNLRPSGIQSRMEN